MQTGGRKKQNAEKRAGNILLLVKYIKKAKTDKADSSTKHVKSI